MRAYELAHLRFSIVDGLQLTHESYRELPKNPISPALVGQLLRSASVVLYTGMFTVQSDQMAQVSKALASVRAAQGNNTFNHLVRLAVVVACMALDSFYWDALMENSFTIVRIRRRGNDKSLPQITLKDREPNTPYDAASIEKIATVLTVRDFWATVAKKCGQNEPEIKQHILELINYGNQIAQWADRLDEQANPPEDQDGPISGAMSAAWAHVRISTAQNVVAASAEIFEATLQQLKGQLAEAEERQQAAANLAPKPGELVEDVSLKQSRGTKRRKLPPAL